MKVLTIKTELEHSTIWKTVLNEKADRKRMCDAQDSLQAGQRWTTRDADMDAQRSFFYVTKSCCIAGLDVAGMYEYISVQGWGPRDQQAHFRTSMAARSIASPPKGSKERTWGLTIASLRGFLTASSSRSSFVQLHLLWGFMITASPVRIYLYCISCEDLSLLHLPWGI